MIHMFTILTPAQTHNNLNMFKVIHMREKTWLQKWVQNLCSDCSGNLNAYAYIEIHKVRRLVFENYQ